MWESGVVDNLARNLHAEELRVYTINIYLMMA
jgi:hypothetical protein